MKKTLLILLALLFCLLPVLTACEDITLPTGPNGSDTPKEPMTMTQAFTLATSLGYKGSFQDFRKAVEAVCPPEQGNANSNGNANIANIADVSLANNSLIVTMQDGTMIDLGTVELPPEEKPLSVAEAYAAAVELGYTGTEDDFTTAITAVIGDKTFTIKNVSLVGAQIIVSMKDGTLVNLTNPVTPSPDDPTAALTLAQAFDAAVALGYTGTEDDFIYSVTQAGFSATATFKAVEKLGSYIYATHTNGTAIKLILKPVTPPDTTLTAMQAYAAAVTLGYTGTEDDFIYSLEQAGYPITATFTAVEKLGSYIYATHTNGMAVKLILKPTTPPDTSSDAVLENIQSMFSGAVADRCTAETTMYDKNGELLYEYSTVAAWDGDIESNSLKIPYFYYITTDENGDFVLPEVPDGTLNGSPYYTKDLYVFAGITFDKSYFKGGTYTYESNTFSATIIDCDAFFGTDLPQNEATVSITFSNNLPKRISISYTDPAGYRFEISMSYTY